MLVLSTNQYTVVIMEKHCQTEVCIAACTAGRRVQQFCKSTMEVKKKPQQKTLFILILKTCVSINSKQKFLESSFTY